MSAVPRTRRRAVVTVPGVVEVVTEPVRPPGVGEVCLQPLLVGVCGSDLHAFRGLHPFVPLPYHPGHEMVATVVAVGEGVSEELLDDRVTVMPSIACGSCKQCRADRENLCEVLQYVGCTHQEGGMADHLTLPADRVRRVPDGMSDRTAVLNEPFATPVHAVRLAPDVRGAAVAVIGAGTIGLLTLAAARAAGARWVGVVEPDPARRDRAAAWGASATFDAGGDALAATVRAAAGESIDVVFDCVAVQSTVDLGIDLTLRGGTTVVVGVPEDDVRVPLGLLQDRQLRLQGTAMFVAEDFDAATRLLHEGAVDAEDVVGASFPLDRVTEAFAAAASGEHVKVVVEI